MSIQEQTQDIDRAAAPAPREGIVAELHVDSFFASMQLRKDDGDVDSIGLWNDANANDPLDRLERTMWLSMCREALIHKKRVRVLLRTDTHTARRVILVG